MIRTEPCLHSAVLLGESLTRLSFTDILRQPNYLWVHSKFINIFLCLIFVRNIKTAHFSTSGVLGGLDEQARQLLFLKSQKRRWWWPWPPAWELKHECTLRGTRQVSEQDHKNPDFWKFRNSWCHSAFQKVLGSKNRFFSSLQVWNPSSVKPVRESSPDLITWRLIPGLIQVKQVRKLFFTFIFHYSL